MSSIRVVEQKVEARVVGNTVAVRIVKQANEVIRLTKGAIITSSSAAADKTTAIAGSTINGNRALIMGSDGKLYHADSTDLTTAGLAVGISTGAASQGESVNYQYRGIMTNEGWNLTEKQPVYFGSNGIITQTVPTGYIQRIGTAITSTKILIQIDTYIVRG